MMTTFVQWVHLTAAMVAVGGLAFLLLVLFPSLQVLDPEQRAALSTAVAERFRWASLTSIALLLLTGFYNIRHYYWEEPWGRAWKFLAVKIILAFSFFGIILALTIPLRHFHRLRARQQTWLYVGLILGLLAVLISAYLRRG